MVGSRTRELLAACSRQGRDVDPEEDDKPVRRATPGKLTTADVCDGRRDLVSGAAPGKLTLADVGRDVMSPADCLAYSERVLSRIDRRAEPGQSDLDDGALASAFAFLESSPGGQPLPAELRRRLEHDLEIDLSRVRLHTDERAARAAASLKARAFALGDDIYFAAGAYDSTSITGIDLIAHEVAHIAQRRAGGGTGAGRISRPDDAHEHQADDFARRFTRASRHRFETSDPAELVERVRREGRRLDLPFMAELEQHFGMPLDFVETYTGEAARLACELMSAGAFAVRNIVALADPSPQRETLLHELTHVVQSGARSARAPARFVPGSLTVGVAGTAAEQEADHHPQAPAERASPDVVHRDTGGASSSAPATAKERVAIYATEVASTIADKGAPDGRNDLDWAAQDGKGFFPRFHRAQVKAWTAKSYVGSDKSKGRKEGDIAEVFGSNGSDVGDGIRLHQASSSWLFTKKSDKAKGDDYKAQVKKVVVPSKFSVAYLGNGSRGISKLGKAFTDAFRWGDHTFEAEDPAISDAEIEQYRHKIVDEVAAKYAGEVPGKWGTFYKDVVNPGNLFPHPYKRIVGTIFEKLVSLATPAGAEQKVENKQLVITWKKKGKTSITTAVADGKLEPKAGKLCILAECKAWTKGPSAKEEAQARQYKEIVTPGSAIGYKGSDENVEEIYFDHVAYYFASPDVSKLWFNMLQRVFGAPDKEGSYSMIPPPTGMTGPNPFRIQYNPTFEIPREEGKNHVHLTPPPIRHAGFKATDLDVRLDDAGDVQSGHITAGVDLAGAVKAAPKRQPITKAESGGAGRVENKFETKTSLTKVLGERVKLDAKLVDDGVEASATITAGASGIPGFELTGGEVKAKYTDAGTLEVSGSVGIERKVGGGTISGNLKVAWAGGEWAVFGDVNVSQGVVDGVNAFTAGFAYQNGEVTITCDQVQIEKKFKAVTLTGTAKQVSYNAKTKAFSGTATLDADMGMFGQASATATIKDSKLAKAELSYDSPELTYPSKSAKPTFKGTIGGTITYENEKFNGSLRGTANLDVPALKKLAGEGGIGLAVDAKIKSDGSYSGSIKTTTPLQFGKHLEIPSIGCEIQEDGSVTGDFSIKIKDIKYLKDASIDCAIDKDGFKVTKADVHAEFGKEGDKMWGGIGATYEEGKGLKIAGTLNVKIKEGMIAKGTVEYDTESGKLSAKLGIEEITLFDKKTTKNLFAFSKQIPLVSFYNIIGIYLDIGFDLDFEFDMKLGLKPTVELEGLSLETFEYTAMAAEIELLGQLRAALVATPKVGLGIFAVSPSLLRGGGGLKIPVTGEALLKPTGKLKVSYSPSGGVEGDALVGMQLTFGIKGSVKPYAEAAILDGAWNPSWTGDSLADFEILPPKELLNFQLDLAGDMSKQDAPAIPDGPQAPSAPGGGKQLPQEKAKTTEAGDTGPGKEATPPTTGPAGGEGADDSVFKMASLTGMLKGLPGYGTITGFMDKAASVWEKIKGFFGRVAKAFKSFFESLGDAIDEVLDGFAAEGLGYLPKLIKKVVGPTVWEIIEPIVEAVAGTADEILELFETDPPKSVDEFFIWGIKLMKKAFGVAFDSIESLVSAINTMSSRLAGTATKMVTQMVTEGMIGVWRHAYYVWMPWPADDYHFLAATEYKIRILDTNISFKEKGMLTSPESAVGIALFEVLESLGVPPTHDGYHEASGQSYRHRWV